MPAIRIGHISFCDLRLIACQDWRAKWNFYEGDGSTTEQRSEIHQIEETGQTRLDDPLIFRR
jgi:hypothetical protein